MPLGLFWGQPRDSDLQSGCWVGVEGLSSSEGCGWVWLPPGEGPKDSEGLWLMAQHRVGGSFRVDEGGVGGAAGAAERQ